MTRTLVLGGPGCGKTTFLLNVVEEALSSGVEPGRIGFVAFTRKAAEEARTRMAEKFGIHSDDIPYFSTLHSLAFRQLGLKVASLLTDERFEEFAEFAGLDFSSELEKRADAYRTPADRALDALNYANVTGIDPTDAAHFKDASPDTVRELARLLANFKEEASILEYQELIERFVAEGFAPPLDLLIVDEAQDLTHTQWQMVDKLEAGVPRVYYAGDDDQAIYAWAGADFNHFMHLEVDERVVLPKSHRLSRAVFERCQIILESVTERYPKDWTYDHEVGEVQIINRLEQIRDELKSGSWFILARQQYVLKYVFEFLRGEGLAYNARTSKGFVSSTQKTFVRAVVAFNRLLAGENVIGTEIECLKKHLPAFGKFKVSRDELYTIDDVPTFARRSWSVVLDLTPKERAYVDFLLHNGEALTGPARITVSTIHAVKGGEADNVVLFDAISRKIAKSYYDEDPSDESRVFYVGASRTRGNLYIHQTRERYYCDALTRKKGAFHGH